MKNKKVTTFFSLKREAGLPGIPIEVQPRVSLPSSTTPSQRNQEDSGGKSNPNSTLLAEVIMVYDPKEDGRGGSLGSAKQRQPSAAVRSISCATSKSKSGSLG